MSTSNKNASTNNQNKRRRDNALPSDTNMDTSSLLLENSLTTENSLYTPEQSNTIRNDRSRSPSYTPYRTNRDIIKNIFPAICLNFPANFDDSTENYVKPT